MKRLLLIPRIRVQNANALSSPYTIGFPAMTAWLGAMHALQRKLNQHACADLIFKSIAVVCHEMELQTYRGDGDFEQSLVGTGNPLDKKGERQSFIEEGRCHLVISLAIEYEGIDADNNDAFLEGVHGQLHANMKIAGGDILHFFAPELLKISEETDWKRLQRKLMPGYAIIERRELMAQAMKSKDNGGEDQDAIDALLDYLTVKHRCKRDKNGTVEWTSERKAPGWLVPIATGFQGISESGQAQNQRDAGVPHRFAESIVTLGEFVMLYRIKTLDDMLWHYQIDPENGLYLCQQNNQR